MTDQQKCPNCGGRGTFVDPPTDPCPACNGAGKVPSEKLPADLIDRAAQLALDEVPVIRDVMRFPDAVVTKMMLAAADPLIEHGRQQEREKWEARIEKLAAEHDEQVAWYQQRAAEQPRTSSRNRKYAEILLSNAESEIRQAERIRSLLTGEGEE